MPILVGGVRSEKLTRHFVGDFEGRAKICMKNMLFGYIWGGILILSICVAALLSYIKWLGKLVGLLTFTSYYYLCFANLMLYYPLLIHKAENRRSASVDIKLQSWPCAMISADRDYIST
jgi:hypothetical protein